MNDFGVLEGGDVLYWPAARDNGGYTFEDETGEPRLREEDGKLSLIMGARVVNGKLSKAFALCEVDHTIARIRHYGNSQDHMSFISSSTIDHETGRGEQWYTAVPWVRCANLLEAQPYDTMLAKGDHLPFYVALRNDGNCYLSGVELTVGEVDGEVIGSMRLDFGEENLVASEWSPPNEDGTLQNVEDDWALAPGTASRYFASYVTIPEDWEGQKQVEVYVTAAYGAIACASRGLFVAAEDSSIGFLPDKRATSTLTLSSAALFANELGGQEMTRADIRVVGDSQGGTDGGSGDDSASVGGDAEHGGGAGSAGGASSGAGGSGAGGVGIARSSLPGTGDRMSATAQTAALYAMGGLAGLVAGAALRAKNERHSEWRRQCAMSPVWHKGSRPFCHFCQKGRDPFCHFPRAWESRHSLR